MKRRVSKMAVILSLAMAAGVLSSCTQNTPGTASGGTASAGGSGDGGSTVEMSANGEFPIVNEKMSFTIMVPQEAYILDVETNEFTKWYEEQTNIHIDWEIVPKEAVTEKVTLSLTTGEYPDAYLGCNLSEADQVKYGSQGIFIPLNDLIEKYSVDFKAAMESSELLPEAITAPDGNIYSLPQINECFHCFYPAKVYMNQEWLKNVGKEAPTTTDEFYEVLKAFKEQDANGNGDPNDEIPMMGADGGWYTDPYSFLLNSFVYWDGARGYALNNGKIEFVANTEEFREGLRYINKLVSEGLIDPVSFTQKEAQAKIIGGDPEKVTVGTACGATFESILGDTVNDPLERYTQYEAISPLKGPNGVQNALTEEGGVYSGRFLITNQCENPEVLFRWADGGYKAEVTLQSQAGPENVGWKKPAEGTLGINGKPALYEKITWTGDSVQNYHLENIMLANRTRDYRDGQAVVGGDPYLTQTGEPRRYRDTETYYEPYASDMQIPILMYTQEESDELAIIQTGLTDFLKENMVAFMTGNKSLDSDWDAYAAEFENLNVSRALEIMQTAYDRQYK